MAAKKTVGQKRDMRKAALAKAPKRLGGDAIDKVISDVRAILGGVGMIARGGDIRQQNFERRPSGIPALDLLMGGGWPKGGLVEIGGQYSCGKTTLCLLTLAHMQRTTREAAFWIALEPFSKTWARQVGFFIPFDETVDPTTGEPADPFDKATELELLRMEQAGIVDPYTEVSPFVLVQEGRGDVALDASLKLLRSNRFAFGVVDSLGIARSTKWLEENDVQDASDFSREAKMIGDYTARACLAANARYDENGEIAKDGTRHLETVMIHLNQVGMEIGTQARAQHKLYRIKGGEGNKHNHHVIIFLWKTGQLRHDESGKPAYVYGSEVNAITLKSKVCSPDRQASYDFYTKPFGPFQAGDVDIAKAAVTLALQMTEGLITQAGAWYTLWDETRHNGRKALEQHLRDDPEKLESLMAATAPACK